MHHRSLIAVPAACLALTAGLGQARAQTQLVPVDPFTARAGPTAGPGRLAPADLRAPSAFDRVYRVMNSGRDTGQYARSQGALVATFSESQYTGAPTSAIPAGTIFHIGTPRAPLARALLPGLRSSRPRPSAAVERPSQARPAGTSARAMLHTHPPIGAPDAPPVPLTLFGDEVYRVRLVSTLLDRALAAAQR